MSLYLYNLNFSDDEHKSTEPQLAWSASDSIKMNISTMMPCGRDQAFKPFPIEALLRLLVPLLNRCWPNAALKIEFIWFCFRLPYMFNSQARLSPTGETSTNTTMTNRRPSPSSTLQNKAGLHVPDYIGSATSMLRRYTLRH
ncbi:hypothetical protein PoB_002621600 [Plakobranchus ocellatus]|uniref:Uncharacterized protein n=1 Tax=Plakobranchus ocellatus TaxID=259542 RepID=A0AAV3ZKR3_9GAST|nr:hypothetical protein PoB_002621600 [Plakobranchus ocellatus]